ncbi:MAG: flagellar basal body-associated FliL family protein [bacterium]|nr:flagellar basal body-associated FliL family protein [bacterium]
MAEEKDKEVPAEGEAKEGAEEAKPKGGLPKILMIAIGAIVLILIVVVVASIVAKKQAKPPELEFEPEVVHKKELPPKPLHVYEIGNYVARLADPEEAHYVKITDVNLYYDAEKYDMLSAELAERQSQIKDIINTILIGKTMEVSTVEGKKALKDEIRKTLNDILRKGKIADIHFQIIVQ